MLPFIKKYLFVCFMILPVHFSFAEEVEIVGYEIPLLMDNPDTGLLVDLIRQIGDRANMKIVFMLLQKDQVPEAVKKHLAFVTRDEHDLGFPGYASRPIYFRKTFAFYKKGMPRIMTIYNLKGRKVGMSSDYDVDMDFLDFLTRNKVKIVKNKVESNLIRYLHKDHVAAFLMDEYAGLFTIKLTPVDDVIIYEARRPIWKKSVHILFPKTEEGKEHADRFNKALQSMHRDGSYKAFIDNAFAKVR